MFVLSVSATTAAGPLSQLCSNDFSQLSGACDIANTKTVIPSQQEAPSKTYATKNTPFCSSCAECNFSANRYGAATLTEDITGNRLICIDTNYVNNVTIDCAGHKISNSYVGVWFERGTQVIVKNCRFENNVYAVATTEAAQAKIFNNHFEQNDYAIVLNSNEDNVSNNSINGCGVGVLLTGSRLEMKSNTISSCTYGLYLGPYAEPGCDNNIDTSNLIDGRPAYYFFNSSNMLFQNLDVGQLHVCYGRNITIVNTTANDGIWLQFVDFSKVNNNRIIDGGEGIFYNQNNNGTVSENFIFEGITGVMLFGGQTVSISKNHLINNSHGVILARGFNSINVSYNIIEGKGSDPGNNKVGIWLLEGNAYVANNLIRDHGVGIEFDLFYSGQTASHTVTENQISDNYWSGLSQQYSGNLRIQTFGNQNFNYNLRHNTVTYSTSAHPYQVYSDVPVKLRYSRQGNYWGRSQRPYFCEYGNQNANCINNWDSNRPDVIDSCPYNQSYAPGAWPESPVCPLGPILPTTAVAEKIPEKPSEEKLAVAAAPPWHNDKWLPYEIAGTIGLVIIASALAWYYKQRK